MNFTNLPYFLLAVTLLSGALALYAAVPRASGQRALRWLFAGLLVSPVANALPAVYHCELDGRVTYQDTPCQLDAITIRVMPILKPPPPEAKPLTDIFPAEPAVVVSPATGVSPKAAEITQPSAAVVRRSIDPTPLTSERKPSTDAQRPALDARPRVERIAQSQTNSEKRSAEVRMASAECQDMLGQIATQKEMLHSLRADTRTQARAKVAALSRDLQLRC